jgi:hypothetical protein
MESWWKLDGILLCLALMLSCQGKTDDAVPPGSDLQETRAEDDAPAAELRLDGHSGEDAEASATEWRRAELLERAGDDGFTECEPGSGCFGEPCKSSSDCLSGLCMEHLGNKVCSVECVEDCPPGWDCALLGAGGPDSMWGCVSRLRMLCRPCLDSSDCTSGTGQEEACVNYGGSEGHFCGGACGADLPCPAGFACLTAEDSNGAESSQCVSLTGACPCSELSISLGEQSLCARENAVGVCLGERTCGGEGLSGCTAMEPAAEQCNGIDDDCDGPTDEETCADDNACTSDSCAGTEGCSYEPLSGTTCDDGNVCTVTDHCSEGLCSGTLVACDDGNFCTDDSCDGLNGCVFEPNANPCDDADPCSLGDSCKAGKCQGVMIPCDCEEDEDCWPLEDENLCNGSLYCDKSGLQLKCQVIPGTVVTCQPPQGIDAACLKPHCVPLTGECELLPANEGLACDDGDACTLGETCVAGVCALGAAPSCNDGNPCTDDTCNSKVGCVHAPLPGECSDGNACTDPDLCGGGECVPGPVVDCDDGNECTKDACKPWTGCTHTPATGFCDDGNACTLGDHCEAGQCAPGSVLQCNDLNPCTDDFCDSQDGCLHEFNSAPCNDASLCTVADYCLGGVCQPGKAVDCSDGNACTEDSCNPLVGCLHTANVKPCDDLAPCTLGDMCTGGVCVGSIPEDCNDGNVCTDDFCIPLAGCSYQVNSAPCVDGNLCTLADTCVKGLCIGGSKLSCDDGNLCTDDSCDAKDGCVHKPNAEPCDDGNSCTTGDHCVLGWCKAGGILSCDDSNPCTTDSCSVEEGCSHFPNSLPCSDGDACTLGDVCKDGLCAPAKPVVCEDLNPCTDNACDKESGCQFLPNQSGCDDGNACTQGDTCNAGQCKAGLPAKCDDGQICTTDTCDPLLGCVFGHNQNPCDDDDVCTVGDVCKGGLCTPGIALVCADDNVCTDDSCNPATGCVHAPNNAPCDDGSQCTIDDACAEGKCVGGATITCDDGNSCTADTCKAAGGCTYSPLPDNTKCEDDGSACSKDVCKNGLCSHEGDGWSTYGGHCYRFFAETMSWDAARNSCKGHGGDLASIGEAAENAFLTALADPGTSSWTCFNDQAGEGSWVWADGTPAAFSNWNGGEPNNSGNEDCMHLYHYPGQPYDGRWNDAPCGSAYPYLCEKAQ